MERELVHTEKFTAKLKRKGRKKDDCELKIFKYPKSFASTEKFEVVIASGDTYLVKPFKVDTLKLAKADAKKAIEIIQKTKVK